MRLVPARTFSGTRRLLLNPLESLPMDQVVLHTTTVGQEAEIERALFALISAHANEPAPFILYLADRIGAASSLRLELMEKATRGRCVYSVAPLHNVSG